MDVVSDDLSPDPDSTDWQSAHTESDLIAGSEPVYFGASDHVQLRYEGTAQVDLTLILVDGSSRTTDVSGMQVDLATAAMTPTDLDFESTTSMSAASSALDLNASTSVPTPSIITRSTWGADESLRFVNAGCGTPEYSSTLEAAVVHHTAGTNAYSGVSQASAIIRSIYAYHVTGRKWCDIGYNFLVDNVGNVYEGRYGSLSGPVKGVHTGGFNTNTVGISVMGDYTNVTPSNATVSAVAQVAAWKLSQYDRDPLATFQYRTGGGENSRYAAGSVVTLNRIFAHRDTAYTACPGERLYAALGTIRSEAAEIIARAKIAFTQIMYSSMDVQVGGQTTMQATVPRGSTWSADIIDTRTGVIVANRSGSASDGIVRLTWFTDSNIGGYVGPGSYQIVLTGRTSNGTVIPGYRSPEIRVTGGESRPTPPTAVPLVGSGRFVPTTPTRILDTRPGGKSLGAASWLQMKVVGVAGIPATGVTAVTINVTAISPNQLTHLRAWPAGSTMPNASFLNVGPQRAVTAASTTVGVGGDGQISIYNERGSLHLAVDITGYFTNDGSGSGYVNLTSAVRLADTRSQSAGSRPGNGSSRELAVAGTSGIPADASALVLNITDAKPSGYGYVTAYGTSQSAPSTSNVNHIIGANVANRAIVNLAQQKMSYLVGGAPTDVILDATGAFVPVGGALYTPLQPERLLDTRSTASPLGAAGVVNLPVTQGSVPGDATAVVLSITAVGGTAESYVRAWPTGSPMPATSDLNYSVGNDQANQTIVPVGTNGSVSLYNDRGNLNLAVDVIGYFK